MTSFPCSKKFLILHSSFLIAPPPPPPPMQALAGQRFSILWKTIFHGVENSAHFFHSVERFFPLCGKNAKKFSIVWKTPALQAGTPRCGLQAMETIP